MTDPISDMLTRIRNAAMVRKVEVRVPYSNMKYAIAKILVDEGFIASAEKETKGHPEIRLALKYEDESSVVRRLKRISKPGKRVYSGYADLPRVLSDHGIAIVSTSRGVMTNKEARKRRLGGEVLCEIN